MMSKQWNKSTYSNGSGGHCVEARQADGGAAPVVQVRDTQNRGLGHLDFDGEGWAALVAALTGR